MAINLSVNYDSRVASDLTAPGYLVKIVVDGSTKLHLSSTGTLSCTQEGLSASWVQSNLEVSGLSSNVAASISGNLSILLDPTDPGTLLSYALSDIYGLSGKSIKIWTFDQHLVSTGTLDAADTLLIFDGICNDISIDRNYINLSLATESINNMFAPRHRINRANGFNFIQPKKTQISWGTEIYILE